MQRISQSFCISKPLSSEPTNIQTTLYELIEAVSNEIKPGEEQWVPFIVNNILNFSSSVEKC